MTTIQRVQHTITTLFYPGCGGDFPEPWQRVHMCTCGVEIGFDEQGLGSVDVDAAFAEHLEEENR